MSSKVKADMWSCLTLGILTQSHGVLCLSALGLAVWHGAGRVMSLQISRSLSAPGLELFIRSPRHQPVLMLKWEGVQ